MEEGGGTSRQTKRPRDERGLFVGVGAQTGGSGGEEEAALLALEQVGHDEAVGAVGFVVGAELEFPVVGAGDEDEFAVGGEGVDVAAGVFDGDGGDFGEGDGDEGFGFADEGLVEKDEAQVGDADETGAAAFHVVDGEEGFAGNDEGGDAVVLVAFVEVYIGHGVLLAAWVFGRGAG